MPMKPYAANATCTAMAVARPIVGVPRYAQASASAVAMTTSSDASAAHPCATTTGMPLAPTRLRASSAAYATSAATTATAPAARTDVRAGSHAEDGHRHAGRVQPPDRGGPALAADGQPRRDRQELQAGADGGHHEHAERDEMQRGERPAETARKARRRVGAGEERDPRAQMERNGGAEEAKRDRRRQQAAPGAGKERPGRELHRARSSLRRTSPGVASTRSTVQPRSASSP